MRRTTCVSGRGRFSRLLLSLFLSLAFTGLARADWAKVIESMDLGDITAFAARSDGYFYACTVDGNSASSTWLATSHGKPGQGAIGEASMHYHTTDMYIFVRTLSGNLYLRTAPGLFNNPNPNWSWVNLGKPHSTTIASSPSSVSYNGVEYAFVVGTDGRLHVVYGAPWTWSDHGAPAGVSLVGTPSALVHDGKLYAFVVGDDGALYVRYWNGSIWTWGSLGTPPSGTVLEGDTDAVSYGDKVHVFVGGADDHVYIRYWNGQTWQWSDQGAAPNGIGAPSARWFEGNDGKKDLYMFAMRSVPLSITPSLFENHWDTANGWETDTHGAPALLLRARPSVTGTFDGPLATQWNVSVFVRGRSDRIYRRLYSEINGTWQWSWPSQYCQM